MKIILSLLLVIPLLGFSQAWQFQAPAGRPLRQVIRQLRNQFGWLITFEDGPYQGGNAPLANNENLLIPSTGPVLLKLDQFDAQHARQLPVDGQDKAVHKLLWQHNHSLKMGALRDIHEGPYIHVVPFLWSNDGRARGYTSLLDSSVTLSNDIGLPNSGSSCGRHHRPGQCNAQSHNFPRLHSEQCISCATSAV